MKSLALVLTLVLSAVGATADNTQFLPLPTSRDGFTGQVCPIGPTAGLTARHVAYVKYGPEPDDLAAVPFRWSLPGRWAGGAAYGKTFSLSLDIAWVESDQPFPYFFPLAIREPQVGDQVTVVGYDDDAKPLVVKAKIVYFGAGLMYFSKTPGPGSSGSCVFNSEGEVIGINFARRVGEEANKILGVGVVASPELVEKLKPKEKEDGK